MTRELVQRIEEEIRQFRFDGKPRSLYDPLRYMMSLGGKRIRPLLVLLAYRLYKDDPGPAIKYAAAVEAFHNFTLVHDDIMDQAPLRRGKPTVHKKWGVNTAILSGDVMLVKVYESFQELEPTKLSEVLRLLNECATGVCEGQQMDMEFERAAAVSAASYLEMIRLKTAVLLGFSLELGAVLADAPPADRERLRQLGIDLGIAFQLKDDLLDVYGEKKKFGKQTGGDIIANKKTFLLISALKQARGKAAVALKRWLKTQKFTKSGKVKAVKAIYDELGVRAITEAKINEYLIRAFDSLDQLSRKDRAAEIRAFVEKLGGRQK
jgi:geranylgeranyl diphosphate synthase type II